MPATPPANAPTPSASAVPPSLEDRQFPLPWAIYLGVSWTWCIGMFLPVLLIRDYGSAAFWVFALPNVIGAAAMGWVLRSPGQSAAVVTNHATAVRVFTLVTVAFHPFFVGWICGLKGDALWPVLVLGAMIGWMVPLARRFAAGGGVIVATAALLVSVGVGAALVGTIRRIDLAEIVQRQGAAGPAELAGLALVCLLGFLACPYLDATFHHARQRLETPSSARWGFGLGFGVVFAAMIGLTYVYADLINNRATLPGLAGSLLVTHMAVQAAATVALHVTVPRPAWSWRGLFLLLFACLGLVAGGWLADRRQGEFGYRLFMSFYGLAAPAYAWLCMLPNRGGAPTGRQLIVTGAAIVLAAPFYWMAFIERQMPWASAGVAVVLLARLLVTRAPEPRAAPVTSDRP